MDDKEMTKVSISEVAPGMITAQDIYSRTDQLILNRNVTLDAASIAKLVFYSVGSLWVYSEPEKKVEEDAYTDVLRKSPEFKEFKQDYDVSLNGVKNTMQGITLGEKSLEGDKMFSDVSKMIGDNRSNVHIFNMLHCIRDYDDTVFMHSVNVALICNVFGDWLRMSDADKKVLTLCGLVHDIGKLLIPKDILDKPAKLTDNEYDVVKQHVTHGYEMLKDMDIDERIKFSARDHHERYNGSGYPNGLKSDEIDSFSVIVGIADVYDAMTSKRIYRGAICPFDVIKIFEDDGMELYDPQFLLPVLGKLAETYIHHTVRLSDERRGEVIMINPVNLAYPVVQTSDGFIDLAKKKDIKIEAIL